MEESPLAPHGRRWIKWAEMEKEEVYLRRVVLQPTWKEQKKDGNIRPVLQAKLAGEVRPAWEEMSSEETKTYWAHWERLQLSIVAMNDMVEGITGGGSC